MEKINTMDNDKADIIQRRIALYMKDLSDLDSNKSLLIIET